MRDKTITSMKKYTKPLIATVKTAGELMGDVNIGIASKPYPGKEDELPMSAKRHDYVPNWEEDDDFGIESGSTTYRR